MKRDDDGADEGDSLGDEDEGARPESAVHEGADHDADDADHAADEDVDEAQDADEDPANPSEPEEAPAPSQRAAGAPTPWLIAAIVTAASAAGVFQAFRPGNAGRPAMLVSLVAIYTLLGALTLWWLHRRGDLRARLAPHRGDVTLGAVIAVGMYLAATGVHILLTSRGSPKEAWLIRVYLQVGDPRQTAAFFIGPVILLIAAAEELVWRGLVLGALADRVPRRTALLATSVLYAAAHLPTVYLLRDPYIGPNPLVVGAALGCGLVWGWLALAVDRISIGMIAHALFTWSVVEFPIMNM